MKKASLDSTVSPFIFLMSQFQGWQKRFRDDPVQAVEDLWRQGSINRWATTPFLFTSTSDEIRVLTSLAHQLLEKGTGAWWANGRLTSSRSTPDMREKKMGVDLRRERENDGRTLDFQVTNLKRGKGSQGRHSLLPVHSSLSSQAFIKLFWKRPMPGW